MAIKTTRWDSADYLKTDEDIQNYMEACLEEAGDDPAFIVHALGVVARAKNMSQLPEIPVLPGKVCTKLCQKKETQHSRQLRKWRRRWDSRLRFNRQRSQT